MKLISEGQLNVSTNTIRLTTLIVIPFDRKLHNLATKAFAQHGHTRIGLHVRLAAVSDKKREQQLAVLEGESVTRLIKIRLQWSAQWRCVQPSVSF